jgi:hypothetical protein
MKTCILMLACAVLSGCIAVPRTVTRYDAACDVEYQSRTLSFEQVSLAGGQDGRTSGAGCSDNCGPLAIAMALVTPASVVVSGSVVLVGNTISWAERKRECLG